jgi:hypothetical protein
VRLVVGVMAIIVVGESNFGFAEQAVEIRIGEGSHTHETTVDDGGRGKKGPSSNCKDSF